MTIAGIGSLIMVLVLFVFAYFFAIKKKIEVAMLTIGLAFIAFVFWMLNVSSVPILKEGFTYEQGLCWVFGMMFFLLAFFFVRKEHLSYGFFTFLICVFMCFCGLSGVQAFLKTHLLMQVTDSLKSYGEKIDKYQTAVWDMHQELSSEQSTLTTNQLELKEQIQDAINRQTTLALQQAIISNQFTSLFAMSNELAIAQTTISEQQSKLSDVEYWVKNLYGNMTHESFSANDTNHILIISSTNANLTKFLFRLNCVPVANSVEAYAKDPRAIAEQRIEINNFSENLALSIMSGFDTNSTSFYIRYVADKRDTNFYPSMPILNKEVFVQQDGWTLLSHIQIHANNQTRTNALK